MRRFPYSYVLLSLAATLTLAGLFYLPYLSVRNKTIKAFHEQQTLLLDQAVKGVQGYFSTYQHALEYLAEQDSILELDSSGKLLMEDFYAIHKSRLLAVFRSDENGDVVFATTGRENSPWSGIDKQVLKQVLLEKALAVSEPIDAHQKECCVVMTQPVFRADVYFGNISFLISFKEVAKRYIDPVKLDRAAYVMLFSRNGITLHAPQPELVGTPINSYRHNELQQLHAKMEGGQKGFFTLTEDFIVTEQRRDLHRHGVYLPVNLPGGTFWSILIVAPENEVLYTMAAFRKQWLIVTVITTIAVGCLSMGLTLVIAGRREEKKQREVEEQLVILLDHAPMGVLLVNGKGTVTYANKAASHMIEVDSRQTLYNTPFLEFIHQDDQGKIADKLRNRQPGNAGEIASVTVTTTGKTNRDAKVSITPFTLGSERCAIVILQDITEELKVEETQRRLATAVEQVSEIVMITDTEGIIEYVNGAFGKMTGYSREEALGSEYFLMCSSDNDKHLFEHIGEVVSRGETWRGRIINKRKNSTVFIVASSVSPVRNHVGRVTHWVTVQRDITNEVEIESRLRQAQKMEAIGTFAGGIAHDFNNILGAIIGFTDMALLQSEKSSELYDHLVHIRQGGKRAADLVHQILTFSRQSTMEKIAVTVAPVIKESLRLIRASIPSTIAIERHILDQDSKVMAAPVQLQQIMMNLCSNAFYSMREKGGTLTIILEQASSDKCGDLDVGFGDTCLCLTVQDTGVGMEDATLQRIFNPFFTTKEPGEGTGMGLSVVLGIVQDLGGDVQVESVVDKGTTFSIYLPLAGQSGSGELLISEAPLPSGTEHVLVIDDEKDIRETFKMMLNHFGYSVTTTSNPKEVLSLLQDKDCSVDLVITDHTMPVMTGLELTEKIAEIRPELPVILCTGYSDKLNLDAAIGAGACALMMKPVDLQELASSVRSALESSVSS
ncbi:PAS domain S-box protein [Desulfogranum marinum]|uniref:PAS domain S-box protein n=1 Tax=Desulfogranum marinum TaxID=453220 RepID=UPI0029C7D298|nr:PAS domain S-box protein [Desulfogranum marinum]